MLGAQAERAPQRRQLQNPQEVGVSFDVFAAVEHQAVAFQQIADVAEADKGIVGQEPGSFGHPAKQPQPRQKDNEHEPLASRKILIFHWTAPIVYLPAVPV